MTEPLVSVVMPAYNAEAFVGSAIESVLAQTYRRLELIVVDDGSTDRTAAVVEGYGERVRYVRQRNAKQAAARNNGVRHAQGEIVAFIDADDVWRPDKLQQQLALLARDPGLGFVYCDAEHIDVEGRYLRSQPGGRRGRILRDVLLGEPIGGLCGSTVLMPRARFEEIGGFDESLSPCEDTDLFWRVAARYPVDFVPKPLVQYRLHPGNAHADLAWMSGAWKRLYRKALRDPQVAALGMSFWLRCYARLYYMLAGDYAHAGRWVAAVGYAFLALLAWPPQIVKLARASTARLGGSSRP